MLNSIARLKGKRFYRLNSYCQNKSGVMYHERISFEKVIRLIVKLQTRFGDVENPIEKHLKELVKSGECYIDADNSLSCK